MQCRGSTARHHHLVYPLGCGCTDYHHQVVDFPCGSLGAASHRRREVFRGVAPDIVVLEVGPKGATLMCSRWSTWLAAKCHGCTFKLLIPVITSPARWSQGGAWLTLGRVPWVVVFASLLLLLPIASTCQTNCSAWCKYVDALHGRIGCHE
jgi:hypothetical protein